MNSNPPILLIDGHNLLVRLCFAMKQTITVGKPPRPIGGILGFLRTLQTLTTKWSPQQIVIAWDTQHNPWRLQQLPTYKAQRDQTNPKLIEAAQQLKELQMLTRWLAINNVSHPELEADDILSFLAVAMGTNRKVIIYSTDQDLAQIIHLQPNTVLLSKDKAVDAANFQATYNVTPENYLFCKALQGDPSDNIAQIPHIGPVTAAKIVNADPTKAAIHQALRDHQTKEAERAIAKGCAPATHDFVAHWETNLRVMRLDLWTQTDGPSNETWVDVLNQARTPLTSNLSEFREHCMGNHITNLGLQMPQWARQFPNCDQRIFGQAALF